MPFYNDLNYHYGYNSLSYSPYYTSSSAYSPFSGYARALSGTYNAPTSRTAYSSNLNRHYKPKLKPISESPFHSTLRSQALTALTRLNSPKNAIVPSTASKYIPPRPILINTANIDVSSSRYEKNRSNRGRSISPEPVTQEADDDVDIQYVDNNIEKSADPGESVFMPRVDQHDPPQFRSTIKRNRNIVRLSTVRSRSKSRSRSDSSKRKSDKSSSSDDKAKRKETSVQQPENSVTEVKSSWRDRFGDTLLMPQKDVVRKTPGELILEKHIIRDKSKDTNFEVYTSTTTSKDSIRMPEIIVPSESTHTEAQRRRSIRRQSLAKCPSFKDICNEIGLDIRKNDDLNAGDLRRRASLIMEQEHQILAQMNNSRRPSAEMINVEEPIIEAEEEVETKPAEVVVEKRKSKRKTIKSKPRFTVTVDVENGIVPLMAADSFELNTPVSPKSPAWKAIVEDVEVEHTINKVITLPKKKPKIVANSVSTQENPSKLNKSTVYKLKKSESEEDFWGKIGRSESYYFKTQKSNLATIEANSLPTSVSMHMADAEPVATDECSDTYANTANAKESPVRKNSVVIVKSNSETDVPKPVRPKLNPPYIKDETPVTKPKAELPKKLPITHEVQSNKPIKLIIMPKPQIKPLKAVMSQKEAKTEAITSKVSNSNGTDTVAGADVIPTSVLPINATVAVDKSQHEEPKKTCTESVMQTDDLKITTGPVAKSPEQKQTNSEATFNVTGKERNSDTSADVNKKGVNAESTTSLVIGADKQESSASDSAAASNAPAMTKKKTTSNATEGVSTKKMPAEASTSATEQKVQSKVDATSAVKAPKKSRNNSAIKKNNSSAKKCTIKNDQIDTCMNDESEQATNAQLAQSNDDIDSKCNSELLGSVSLSKFPTIGNLSDDLSFIVDKSTAVVCNDTESCISGEETFDFLSESDEEEYSDSEEYSESGEDEMGLKRRHKKKREKFDPNKVVKLDHSRKCYIVDEAPKYPLIATPRPLQKKYHYHSESDSDNDSDSGSGSSDELYQEYLSPNDGIIKDVIRMSTCSNDSGFEGGGTAPASPKKMLGKDISNKIIFK